MSEASFTSSSLLMEWNRQDLLVRILKRAEESVGSGGNSISMCCWRRPSSSSRHGITILAQCATSSTFTEYRPDRSPCKAGAMSDMSRARVRSPHESGSSASCRMSVLKARNRAAKPRLGNFPRRSELWSRRLSHSGEDLRGLSSAEPRDFVLACLVGSLCEIGHLRSPMIVAGWTSPVSGRSCPIYRRGIIKDSREMGRTTIGTARPEGGKG